MSIVNKIMSFTCVGKLKIAHNTTDCILEYGVTSSVYKRLMIMQKKHCIALLQDNSKESKEASYVRQTGGVLKDQAMQLFSSVILMHEREDTQLKYLKIEYIRLCVMIERRSSRHLFHIYTTIMGETGCYI